MRAKEILLLEDHTKGAKNILANKNLVAAIADQIRMDHTIPPEVTKDPKKTDLDLATWFVDQLDSIEEAGHVGVPFSRNGQYHMWAATNYSQGRDIWEELSGEMAPALTYFTTLKNRVYPPDWPKEELRGKPMLDPRHQDIGKYKGVKDLHRYMVTHYKPILDDITKKAREQSLEKWMTQNARSVKLATTPEYDLYLLQNWPAAFKHGKGCAFCTFNSRNDYQFQHYSKNSPLFGLVPKLLPRIEKGEKSTGMNILQKFQFDPATHSFKDYRDAQADPKFIKETFPYLFDDLVKGMLENQDEIENPSPETVRGQGPRSDNTNKVSMPTSPGAPMEKKAYNVADVISQLKTKLKGYWTDKKRPAEEEPPTPDTATPDTPPTPPTA